MILKTSTLLLLFFSLCTLDMSLIGLEGPWRFFSFWLVLSHFSNSILDEAFMIINQTTTHPVNDVKLFPAELINTCHFIVHWTWKSFLYWLLCCSKVGSFLDWVLDVGLSVIQKILIPDVFISCWFPPNVLMCAFAINTWWIGLSGCWGIQFGSLLHDFVRFSGYRFLGFAFSSGCSRAECSCTLIWRHQLPIVIPRSWTAWKLSFNCDIGLLVVRRLSCSWHVWDRDSVVVRSHGSALHVGIGESGLAASPNV